MPGPGGMGAMILGGFVTFTVSLEQAKGITLPVTAEAELPQALPLKDVPIVDFAVNLDGLAVRDDGLFFKGCRGALEGRERHRFAMRRDNAKGPLCKDLQVNQ